MIVNKECALAHKKSRTIKKSPGRMIHFLSYNFFSHPDYTVGFGISPNQLLSQVADFTAGGELRPAPKNDIYLSVKRIAQFLLSCNSFLTEVSVRMTGCHTASKLCHFTDGHKLISSSRKLRDQRFRSHGTLLIKVMH